MESLPDTQHRVSSVDRERAISHLQEAYIRGRLSERELGERIDRALGAVVKLDLAELVSDLPALAPAAPATPVAAVRAPWWRRRAGENVYKSTLRKNGAWSVPPLYRSRVYKGMLILDLRQALLSASETTLELNAYKSHVAIIVPPEYNIELEGSAYKGRMENLSTGGLPGAPRLLIRGSAYKGSIIVTDSDPEAPESPYPVLEKGR